MDRNIGFIGLGIMGGPMAGNLVKGGFLLTVYNRTPEKTEPLREAGAAVASSPFAVGEEADTVFLMLTGPEAVEAVLFGDNGLVSSASCCRMVVNMSTVPPAFNKELARRLKEHGLSFVEAPVSGSRQPAAEGSLVILAGGPKAEVISMEPALKLLGKQVVYCGEVGAGTDMKMVVNLILATMIGGLAESLALGEKCGLATRMILEIVLAGPLGCGLFSLKKEMFETGQYPVQFPFRYMLKDLNFILATAEEAGIDAKIGATLRDLYKKGMEQGLADQDFAAVKKVIEA
jgi:3-hydroxyisobutyrate dehydrogenase-like beta-hydroxyacid dehydrogenase